MKKSVWKIFLALVFVSVAFSGCAPAPTPVPPTFAPTPSPIPPTFTPEPTSTATPLPSITPTSISTDTPATPLDPGHLSVADTKTVEFLGKKFELKFKVTDQLIPIFEYYPPNQTPSDWIELVAFQIFPVNPDGNKPIDFAKRTANAFMQQYPDMTYGILVDDNSEAVILDFFYPTSTRKEKGKDFIEFNAFKIFRDPGSDQIIWFHYAKNIEGILARSPDDFMSEFNKTRKEVLSALTKFPVFSQ